MTCNAGSKDTKQLARNSHLSAAGFCLENGLRCVMAHATPIKGVLRLLATISPASYILNYADRKTVNIVFSNHNAVFAGRHRYTSLG